MLWLSLGQAATATPYAIQARPMAQMAQFGVAFVSIGILLLISIPGLIWIRHNIFKDEEKEPRES